MVKEDTQFRPVEKQHVHGKGCAEEHGHNHGHAHGHLGHHHHGTVDNLKVALILNFSFSIIEFIGGIYTGSVAILADAVHDFGDSLSLALAIVFERVAKKGSDQSYSYGYRRLSLLSALLTCGFLLAGSTAVVIQAVPRLLNPVMPKVGGMMVFALMGIAVNGYAAWRVHRGGKTMNERVVSWHLIEDVFGWVAVLIGAVVMAFVDVPILDPVLSIGFTLFILYRVAQALKDTLKLFLQATPASVDLPGLRRAIEALPGVRGTHDAHLWSLDGESHVLTLHVVVDEGMAQELLKTKIRLLVAKRGKIHVTLEIETLGVECPEIDCGEPP